MPSLSFAEDGSDPTGATVATSEPPPGLVKSILPCTPLAIVKALEHVGVYNQVLEYGRRAFGRTVTVINRFVRLRLHAINDLLTEKRGNRSEVVGRPLAALLANDGARVFSVDEYGIVEYSRRKPAKDGSKPPAWHPTHITVPCSKSLKDCLEISDAVVSGS